jgi:hypothetical protein
MSSAEVILPGIRDSRLYNSAVDLPLHTFRWSPWRWLVRLFLVGFAITVALVLAEVGLRGLVAVKRASRIETVVRLVNQDWPFSSEGWAYRFYKAHSSGGALIQDSLYRVHPTRGWICSPNISMWRGEYHYTTNRFGHRGPFTPHPDSRKIKVMLLGDSQTFGEEVDDIFAWPNILASQHKELEIINLSVGGYGLDQMYITFTEEFEFWKPDIVVFAPIPDDLYRSSLWFRDFSKPYFEPVYGSSGEVKELIPHAPVIEMSQLLRNLESNRAVIGRRFKLISLFTSVMDMRVTTSRNWVRSHDINSDAPRPEANTHGRCTCRFGLDRQSGLAAARS